MKITVEQILRMEKYFLDNCPACEIQESFKRLYRMLKS